MRHVEHGFVLVLFSGKKRWHLIQKHNWYVGGAFVVISKNTILAIGVVNKSHKAGGRTDPAQKAQICKPESMSLLFVKFKLSFGRPAGSNMMSYL